MADAFLVKNCIQVEEIRKLFSYLRQIEKVGSKLKEKLESFEPTKVEPLLALTANIRLEESDYPAGGRSCLRSF